MGKTSYRKRKRLGPLPIWINYSWSQTRGSNYSFSIKLGPWTYNTKQKVSTIDLPGGFKHRHQHGKAQAARPRAAHPSRRREGPKTLSGPSAYRPAKWPWVLWAIVCVFGVLGGWQVGAIVFWLVVAAAIGTVQVLRYRHAGTPVRRDAVEPAQPAMDPAEAERIVREWQPPKAGA